MNSVFEFTGELSTKVKKRICNIHKITTLIILTISTPISLLISLPVIGLLMENGTKIALIVTALSYPVLMIMLALIYPTKYEYPEIFPKIIYITDDGYIVSRCEKAKREDSIDGVKNVKDYGEWYEINFSGVKHKGFFVCQKDLLTKGSIEEFEKLFEGRIERIQNK
ncbi:MAG: hypothetical protein E7675_00240 [Ruminococcaceae bacterium]|nr:hypothetical protein [Oscillospiraceae bacterium]